MTMNEAIEKLRAAFPAVRWDDAEIGDRIIGVTDHFIMYLDYEAKPSNGVWRARIVAMPGCSNANRDPVAAMRGAFTKARKRIVRDLDALDAARRGAS